MRDPEGPSVLMSDSWGVRLAKNDFGSVFGLILQKTAVFGSVSVLQINWGFSFFGSFFALSVVLCVCTLMSTAEQISNYIRLLTPSFIYACTV